MKNLEPYKKLKVMFGIVSALAALAVIFEIIGIILSKINYNWLADYAKAHNLESKESTPYINVILIMGITIFIVLGWIFIIKAKTAFEVKAGFLLAIAIIFTILAVLSAFLLVGLVMLDTAKLLGDKISEDDKTNILNHIDFTLVKAIIGAASVAIIAQCVVSWFAWRAGVGYNKSIGQINV